MKVSEAYDRFLLKVEKNSTNDNISTDRRRFVELYNEAQNRFVEYIYDMKNEDDFRYIEKLLVIGKKLEKGNVGGIPRHYSFLLPKDYFEHSSVYALGSKGSCKNQRIDLPLEVNDMNLAYHLNDEFTKPSFEYRESLYTIGSGSINVYAEDFDITSVLLNYYRYPIQIGLQNPNNPESDFIDIDLDFDEKVINRILSAAAMSYTVNDGDPRYQLHNLFAKKEL